MTGETIKKLRLGLGWTQEQMAEFLCLNHRNQICRIEKPEYQSSGVVGELLQWLATHREYALANYSTVTAPLKVSASVVKQTRRKAKMTLAAMGKRLGVSWRYVRDLESGKRLPNRRIARLLCLTY